MPNKYKRKIGSRKYRDFTDETLQRALADVKNGVSIKNVAQMYDIPKSTIHRKLRNKNMCKPGGPTILTDEEERVMTQSIITASDWGFPLEREDIKDLVRGYLQRQGRTIKKFNNNKPGDSWYYGFIARHRELTIRLSENIKRSRAAISIDMIHEYFDSLTVSLKDVEPENILNYDESGFVDDPGRNKVVVRKNTKHAERVMDFSKTNTSVMFCVSGSGVTLPPYVVYKADHIWSTWTERGPQGTRYNRSKSGWFDQSLFEDWFVNVALPYMKKLNGPKVLIGDNLASHISIKVLQECQANNIRFVLLPPNSTHLTQPLDVSCFRPIKAAWKRILKIWKTKNRGPLRKDMFPCLLRQTLEKIAANSAENIKSGFRTTGIIPIDREEVLKKLPKQDRGNQPATDITRTLTNMFQEARFGKKDDGSSSTSLRRKKLNIRAGQSVSLEDVQGLHTENNLSKHSTKKHKQSLPTSRMSENDSSDTEIDKTENETDETHNIEMSDTDSTSYENLEIDDYVIVELKSVKGRSHRFVGKVIEKNPLRCSYMKLSAKLQDTFVFPNIPDEGDLEETEFVTKLPAPTKLRRGSVKFNAIILQKHKVIAP